MAKLSESELNEIMMRRAGISLDEDDSAEKISALDESETLVETEEEEQNRLMEISKRTAGIR